MNEMKAEPTVFLVAEDDADDRAFMEEIFRRTDCHLRLVTNGAEAIEYLEGKGLFFDREEFPLPDVILLDLNMPLMDGFAVSQWVRTRGPVKLSLIPIVMVSSSDDPADIERAYAVGVNSYLIKPLDWRELQQQIAAIKMFWGGHVATPPVPISVRVAEPV